MPDPGDFSLMERLYMSRMELSAGFHSTSWRLTVTRPCKFVGVAMMLAPETRVNIFTTSWSETSSTATEINSFSASTGFVRGGTDSVWDSDSTVPGPAFVAAEARAGSETGAGVADRSRVVGAAATNAPSPPDASSVTTPEPGVAPSICSAGAIAPIATVRTTTIMKFFIALFPPVSIQSPCLA